MPLFQIAKYDFKLNNPLRFDYLGFKIARRIFQSKSVVDFFFADKVWNRYEQIQILYTTKSLPGVMQGTFLSEFFYFMLFENKMI